MSRLRPHLIALSLANLCFLEVWTENLENTYFLPYYSKSVHPAWNLLAVMLSVLLLAGVFIAARALWTAARRDDSPRMERVGQTMFILLGALPLAFVSRYESVRRIFPPTANTFWSELLGDATPWIAVLAGAAFLWVVWKWSRPLSRALATALVVLAPFTAITFGQGLWAQVSTPAPAVLADKPSAVPFQNAEVNRTRVVWMIFDELDQGHTYEARIPGLELDEFDRLRATSLYATRASAPADDTIMSTTTLVAGETILAIEPNADADLDVLFYSQEKLIPWSEYPSLFSRVQAKQLNVAAAGWFQPYCRLFGHLMTGCHWEPYMRTGEVMSFSRRLLVQWILFVRTLPWAGTFFREDPLQLNWLATRIVSESHVAKYRRILAAARSYVADPNLDVIYLHWPIPHGPSVYDWRTGEFSSNPSAPDWYDGNLALVDRTLAALRREMEEAGLWNRTVLIVSGDHPLRHDSGPLIYTSPKSAHVPFLVRFPGEGHAEEYTAPLRTIITHDLILAILDREVESPAQVARWLNSNGPSLSGDAPIR